MANRATMTNLISTLRGMTNAGTADYSIRLTSYWSNDQLQQILDRYSTPVRDELLNAIPAMSTGGTSVYFDYQSKGRFFENSDAGTARFVVKDVGGTVAGTALWGADYERGLVTFVSNTAGSAYYLTGFTYDVYAAAADVWYQKAAQASDKIDFSTDGHNIKRSHLASMAYKMAQKYEAMAGVSISSSSNQVELVRGDME